MAISDVSPIVFKELSIAKFILSRIDQIIQENEELNHQVLNQLISINKMQLKQRKLACHGIDLKLHQKDEISEIENTEELICELVNMKFNKMVFLEGTIDENFESRNEEKIKKDTYKISRKCILEVKEDLLEEERKMESLGLKFDHLDEIKLKFENWIKEIDSQ